MVFTQPAKTEEITNKIPQFFTSITLLFLFLTSFLDLSEWGFRFISAAPAPPPKATAPSPRFAASPRPFTQSPRPVQTPQPDEHRPLFQKQLTNQCLQHGGTAYFECKVDGYPPPEILWTRRGHPLVDKARSVYVNVVARDKFQTFHHFTQHSAHGVKGEARPASQVEQPSLILWAAKVSSDGEEISAAIHTNLAY